MNELCHRRQPAIHHIGLAVNVRSCGDDDG